MINIKMVEKQILEMIKIYPDILTKDWFINRNRDEVLLTFKALVKDRECFEGIQCSPEEQKNIDELIALFKKMLPGGAWGFIIVENIFLSKCPAFMKAVVESVLNRYIETYPEIAHLPLPNKNYD